MARASLRRFVRGARARALVGPECAAAMPALRSAAMGGQWVHGAAVLLAVLLYSAGVLKAARPEPLAAAVRRLLPRRPRALAARRLVAEARLFGVAECVIAVLLLVTGGRAAVAVAVATVAVFAGFTGAILVAIRRGTACGCWASFSDGPAGGTELARTAVLLVYAAVLAAGRLTGDVATPISGPAVAAAAVLLVGLLAASLAGGAVWPLPADRRAAGGKASRLEPAGRLLRVVVGAVTSGARPAEGPAPDSRRRLTGQRRDQHLAWLAADPSWALAEAHVASHGGAVEWRMATVMLRTTAAPGPGARSLITLLPCGRDCTLTAIAPHGGPLSVLGRCGDESFIAVNGRLHVTPPAGVAVAPGT